MRNARKLETLVLSFSLVSLWHFSLVKLLLGRITTLVGLLISSCLVESGNPFIWGPVMKESGDSGEVFSFLEAESLTLILIGVPIIKLQKE